RNRLTRQSTCQRPRATPITGQRSPRRAVQRRGDPRASECASGVAAICREVKLLSKAFCPDDGLREEMMNAPSADPKNSTPAGRYRPHHSPDAPDKKANQDGSRHAVLASQPHPAVAPQPAVRCQLTALTSGSMLTRVTTSSSARSLRLGE